MSADTPHLSDERLMLLVDGELRHQHVGAARRHLSGCPDCRTRFEQIEASTIEFGRAYQRDRDAHGARTVTLRHSLKEQLADLRDESRPGPSWAIACAILVAALLGIEFLSSRSGPVAGPGDLRTAVRPIASLTPGATRAVAATDLCSARGTAPRVIPPHVRQAVVRDYRMELVSAHDYELDYLITPELGGSDDRRNLWPERYSSDLWNARVKDELERLLPRLVCAGTVPLATAQREMATDWIAAYRKYFHTDRPLHVYSPFAALDMEDDRAPSPLPDRVFEAPSPRSGYIAR